MILLSSFAGMYGLKAELKWHHSQGILNFWLLYSLFNCLFWLTTNEQSSILLGGPFWVSYTWSAENISVSWPNHENIWARSRNSGCLVTWFCYQLIAKPGNKTATVSWPNPYTIVYSSLLKFDGIRAVPGMSESSGLMLTNVHNGSIPYQQHCDAWKKVCL